MASNYDAEEFVDEDFQTSSTRNASLTATTADPQRAPTREEVESRVNEMQHKLAELKQAQSDLEKQRAGLEELRRRQAEFGTGRQEMTHHLIRGVAILEDAELDSRREVEQLSRTLTEFREALDKIHSIHEESWTKENLEADLTRAMTIVENARMEWNSALIKLPILSGEGVKEATHPAADPDSPFQELLRQKNYAEICKLGLALTWPVALTGLGIFLVLLIR